MLDTLRAHSRSALIYVFFGIIIIVFVFSFGPGSTGCRAGNGAGTAMTAATVNGQDVAMADYQDAYARTYREYQQRAGGAFTEELAQTLRLKSTVLEQLIDRVLLAQAAAQQGIRVSDRELSEEIKGIPAFQVDGKFDREQYRLIVERQLGTTPALFEEDLRRSLLAQKLVAGLVSAAKVSEDEVRAEFVREKDKWELSFVRFTPQAFKAQVAKPDEARIDAFLKDNGPRVEASYNDNPEKYNKPKRIVARQILIAVPSDAKPEQVDAARKKADELKAKLAGGADFAALARQSSDDPTGREKGGEIGEVNAGQLPPELRDPVMKLEAGQVTDPIRTQAKGFHLVKADRVIAEEKKTLDQVKREIAAELIIEDEAKKLARAKAEEALAQVKAGKKLEEIYPAKAGSEPSIDVAAAPQTETTGPFSPSGDYVPRIGMDSDLTRAVMTLTEKAPAPDKVFDIHGSSYVVALKSRQLPDLKELEEKGGEYRERARQRKANDLVESFVKSLKAKAQIERNDTLVEPDSAPDLQAPISEG